MHSARSGDSLRDVAVSTTEALKASQVALLSRLAETHHRAGRATELSGRPGCPQTADGPFGRLAKQKHF